MKMTKNNAWKKWRKFKLFITKGNSKKASTILNVPFFLNIETGAEWEIDGPDKETAIVFVDIGRVLRNRKKFRVKMRPPLRQLILDLRSQFFYGARRELKVRESSLTLLWENYLCHMLYLTENCAAYSRMPHLFWLLIVIVHIIIPAHRYLRHSQIHLLVIPDHSSHILQSLDLTLNCFAKDRYKEEYPLAECRFLKRKK